MRLILCLLILPMITAAAFSSPTGDSGDVVSVVRSYSLHGDDGTALDWHDDRGRRGRGRRALLHEVRPVRRDARVEYEDEVESLYPTVQRAFVIPDGRDTNDDNVRSARARPGTTVVNVRQTSFGCGRLGATVWPSSIALAALLSRRPFDDGCRDQSTMVAGRRVLELGSGCGLPSAVASMLGAACVLATDHWEEEEGGGSRRGRKDDDGDGGGRLMPKNPHGANLAHNVVGASVVPAVASVRRLDWHDEGGARDIANDYRPDLIIGSDLIYYPADVSPLLRTLGILLGDDGGGKSEGVKGGGEERRRREALLISPLPPNAERASLGEFRARLATATDDDDDDGWLVGCEVLMDELVMIERTAGDDDGDNGDEERHNLLAIRIL
ncbi:hypothetical protein ACHAW5_006999 [Stephanodiscus triporus]|uniref:Calmodulin-lysine N-methyltransferase n=1 Tax=Stephanodiscus triporus TaxID=2934178 RepID=A0ABD3MUQ2_9STRA